MGRVSASPRPVAGTVDRLDDGRMSDGVASWVVTLVITAFAFALRIHNVSTPGRLVFDETYYPKDAWTMLHQGYEGTWPDGASIANPSIAKGDVNIWNSYAEFAVHPPLGKWIIAVGEQLFGMNSFGWRIGSVVFGTLMVLMVIRLARRLSRSTMVGAIAGILITLDGLSFVMSRIGLLDIFQAFFLVAGVAAVAADRDWFRHRLADHLRAIGKPNLGGAYGPALWFRPWRLAAGLMLGAACAVKWNSMYVLASMGIVSVCWDWSARRLAGARRRSWWSLLRDGVPAFVHLVVVALAVYLASWARWLQVYPHMKFGSPPNWAGPQPDPAVERVVGRRLAALWDYHKQIYDFHTGSGMMHQTHPYSANPSGWLINQRPIGIDAVNDIKPGTHGCQAVNDTCLRVISGTGTPILWWMALIALAAAVVWWIAGRDWRFTLPIVAMASTWVTWFRYDDRPLFFFYAICIIPFTVTILAIWLGQILGPAEDSSRRRLGAVIVGAAVAVAAADFAFIYPILTDQLMTRKAWLARMWFRSWI